MNGQKQLVHRHFSFISKLVIFLLLASLMLSPQPVYAASNWYVTTTGNDLNSCATPASPCLTINGAIGKALSGDTIYVATGTYTSSTTEVVLIDKDLTLSGGWDTTFTAQSGTSIIDGQDVRRGITIPLGITATIDTFTIENGYHDNQGGGIRNNGTLTIKNSIIQNNVSHWMGGGIFTFGTLTVNDTVIDGNSAGQIGYSGGGGGGGIQNYNGTTTLNNSTVSNNILLGFFDGSGINNYTILILNNSTVNNNTNSPSLNYTGSIYSTLPFGNVTINNTTISSNTGAGILSNSVSVNNSTIIYNLHGFNGTGTITNSIVAKNTDYDCTVTSSITSGGYNIIGNDTGCTFSPTTGDLVGTSLAPIDPLLGPLQDNGGLTFTHNLLWGSPAIDAGNPAAPGSGGNACLAIDQRGVIRPIDDNVVFGAVCDIGAVEFNDNTPKVVIVPTAYNASEQVSLNLHGTGISVGDINDDPLTVTVTTTDANSQISADVGSTGAVVSFGNGTNNLVLTGSVAQLNDLFAGNLGSTLTYVLDDDTPVASVTLTITADDGSSTGSDTAIINITAVNDPPLNTVPGAQIMNEDTALVFSSGNGNQISVSDVDAGSNDIQVTLSVTNGTLTLTGITGLNFIAGDGTADTLMVFQGTLAEINNTLSDFTFDPTTNYFGNAVLAITTSDLGNTGTGNVTPASDTVTITVNNINDLPFVANPIPDQNATEDSPFSFQFAANTFGDPDPNDTFTYSAQLAGGGVLPAWLSFDPATRTFNGTPLNPDIGTVSIDVIADDGNGGTITDTFNIVVANTNDPPVVDNPIPDQNATEDSPFSFQFAANTFSDPDVGDTLSYSAQLSGGGALPAWLSFDPATRTFSGTPSNADIGTISVDVIAEDGNGGMITDTFDVTVLTVLRVTIDQAITQVDPTNVSPILFTVVFSEPIDVPTFTSADIIFAGTAPGTLSAVITEIVPNDNTTFEVSISGMTGSGTVTASMDAGVVQDGAGGFNTASTSTDNSVLYDQTYPIVVSTSLKSSYNNSGPKTFTITFSESVNNPIGSTDPDDATNPANYLLVENGVNDLFDTTSCSGGLIADDTQVIVNSITYNTATYTATVTLNTSLPIGNYRLFVCGTTSIVDLADNPLAGNGTTSGTDYTFDFVVRTSSTANTSGSSLPDTGFAPNRTTSLSAQPASLAYSDLDSIWLEIPSLNIKTDIVGVPKSADGWNVDWLGNSIGWLNGTAFPSWEGNSVVTGHVYNVSGLPGPFVNLKNLKYGDQVIVHMYGEKYIFEVQESNMVSPRKTDFALQHLEGHSYLTLITCQVYNPITDSYFFRRIVRTVLVDVKGE